MANTFAQKFVFSRGEDVTITLTADATNPAAWTFLVTIRPPGGDPLALSPTVTAGGTAGAYTLTFSMTRAQTLTLTGDVYWFDVWRMSSGSAVNYPLAGGTFHVKTPVRATS